MIEGLVLSLFAVLVVGAAVYAAFVPHTLHCIIGLAIVLFGVAVVFLYLGSPFLAAIQLLIYIGGISVAMIFALMLSVSLAKPMHHAPRKVIGSAAVAVLFVAVMAMLVLGADFPLREGMAGGEAWSPRRIGEEFITTYDLAFQSLVLALLVSIIAAVRIARRGEDAP